MAVGCSRESVAEIFLAIFLLQIQRGYGLAEVVVGTQSGKIRGSSQRVQGTLIYSFHGIPYGKAPVGALRFHQLVEPEPWPFMKDTWRSRPLCQQPSGGKQWLKDLLLEESLSFSEDCLYINVFTPTLPDREFVRSEINKKIYGPTPFPVVVLFLSDPSLQVVKPLHLVREQNLVIVTASFRRGSAGYLCVDKAANLAFTDQRAALLWVKENIHHFNGDKQRVTLLGHGDAAADVGLHLVLKKKPLFNRVWMSGGSPLQLSAMAPHPGTQAGLMSSTHHCPLDDELLNCLRAKPVLKESIEAPWRPCADGKLLPKHAAGLYRMGRWHPNIDVILGYSQMELYEDIQGLGSYEDFTEHFKQKLDSLQNLPPATQKLILDKWVELYQGDPSEELIPPIQAFTEAYSDMLIASSALRTADYHSTTLDPVNIDPEHEDKDHLRRVYVYEYTYGLSPPARAQVQGRAIHGHDILALLGVPCNEKPPWIESDCDMSKVMMAHLGNFARSGQPNSPITSTYLWPKYKLCEMLGQPPCDRVVFSIRTPDYSRVLRDSKKDKFDFWLRTLYGDSDPTPTILRYEPFGQSDSDDDEDHQSEKVEIIHHELVSDNHTELNKANISVDTVSTDTQRDEL